MPRRAHVRQADQSYSCCIIKTTAEQTNRMERRPGIDESKRTNEQSRRGK